MNIVIKRAISIVGTQKKLASVIGVDQSAVSKWLRGGGIRSQYIPGLVAATKGQITADEIIHSLSSQENTAGQELA